MDFFANLFALLGVGYSGSPAEDTLMLILDEPEMPNILIEKL